MKDYFQFLLNPWALIFFSAIADSYAAFVVKLKFNELGKIDLGSFNSIVGYISKMLQSPLLVSAIAAYVLAPAIWFIALNKTELSIAYPIVVVLHLIFMPLLGIFFLKEAISLNKLIGIGLILFSLYFFYKK